MNLQVGQILTNYGIYIFILSFNEQIVTYNRTVYGQPAEYEYESADFNRFKEDVRLHRWKKITVAELFQECPTAVCILDPKTIVKERKNGTLR